MELTKNGDKLVCYLYKEYLNRIKNGISIHQAKQFDFSEISHFKPFKDFQEADVKETIASISRANLGSMTLEGNFFANDSFLIYMESRFKNGLNDVLDTISKFIP